MLLTILCISFSLCKSEQCILFNSREGIDKIYNKSIFLIIIILFFKLSGAYRRKGKRKN